jgi:hypothetical protein
MICFIYYNNATGRIHSSSEKQSEPPAGCTELYTNINISDANKYYVTNSTLVLVPIQSSPVHEFNYVTKQWEDPRTLQDIKLAKWNQIKQARTQVEYTGFIWNNLVFDSDTVSQNRISGAVTLASLNPSFSIGWTLADNTTRTLNQGEMIQVGAALATHVTTQFAKGVVLRAQIEAAITIAEVENIVW